MIRVPASRSCFECRDTSAVTPSYPSVILLDALGTLVRLRPPAPRLRAELAQRFGISVTAAQAQDAVAAEMAYYRAHLNRGSDASALARLRSDCAAVLRAALPPSPRLAALTAMQMTDALMSSLRFVAFDDAVPALQAARRRGQRLVVVSNWDCSLPDVLARAGSRPSSTGSSPRPRWGSPNPLRPCSSGRWSSPSAGPECALHVGDRVHEDVAGAHAAGVRPVLLRRDGAPAPTGGDDDRQPGTTRRFANLLAMPSVPPPSSDDVAAAPRMPSGPRPAPAADVPPWHLWMLPAVLALGIGLWVLASIVVGIGAHAAGTSITHPTPAVSLVLDLVFDPSFVARRPLLHRPPGPGPAG